MVFVAISTKDHGLAAATYIWEIVCLRKPVVTCEKGSLSEYFHRFRPYLNRIGYNTTVGGASFILDLLKDIRTVRRATAVLNGSCNNISTLIERGWKIEDAIAKTQKDGYTDPGQQSTQEIINNEIADACRKAVILHNLINSKHSVKYSEMSHEVFSGDGMYHLFTKSPGQDYAKRLIIDIYMLGNEGIDQDPGISCFWTRTPTHYISGSFRDPTSCFPMIPRGAYNCLRVEYGNGKADFQYGVGAGVTETAQAMIVDAERLLESN